MKDLKKQIREVMGDLREQRRIRINRIMAKLAGVSIISAMGVLSGIIIYYLFFSTFLSTITDSTFKAIIALLMIAALIVFGNEIIFGLDLIQNGFGEE